MYIFKPCTSTKRPTEKLHLPDSVYALMYLSVSPFPTRSSVRKSVCSNTFSFHWPQFKIREETSRESRDKTSSSAPMPNFPEAQPDLWPRGLLIFSDLVLVTHVNGTVWQSRWMSPLRSNEPFRSQASVPIEAHIRNLADSHTWSEGVRLTPRTSAPGEHPSV